MPLFDIFASPRWSPLRMRTKAVSFFIFFQELSNKKKIKAPRPKMTKIASKGSCLNQWIDKGLVTRIEKKIIESLQLLFLHFIPGHAWLLTQSRQLFLDMHVQAMVQTKNASCAPDMDHSLGDHILQKEAERVDSVSCTDVRNSKWNKWGLFIKMATGCESQRWGTLADPPPGRGPGDQWIDCVFWLACSSRNFVQHKLDCPSLFLLVVVLFFCSF